MGLEEEAPYDAIHVGAAAPNVPQAVSLPTGRMILAKASLWCPDTESRRPDLSRTLGRNVVVKEHITHTSTLLQYCCTLK